MRKSIVIDLDNTLLATNTFKRYIMFVGMQALKLGRIDICISVACMVIWRKLRLISHEKMKKIILVSTRNFMTKPKINAFIKKLTPMQNVKVLELLSIYSSKDYLSILSTAAPISYAEEIAFHYGFKEVVATGMIINKEWKENFGETKKQATMELLKKRNADIAVFVTDHSDDLPLLLVPKERNILVNPTPHSLEKIQKAKVSYELL